MVRAMAEGGRPLGVAIVGLDHWYLGLAAARLVSGRPDARLVVVAHHDAARAEMVAGEYRAGRWTTDYESAVRADDVDVVATACRVSENPAICVAAAEAGKHIVSTKPLALDVAGAEAIAGAVRRAGVRFLSGEMSMRLSPAAQRLGEWIAAGRIGELVSVLIVQRAPLPTQPWPGESGPTWWTDPRYVAAGGWLDHAIYHLDHLRALLGEPERVSGELATLVHREVPLEDFGVATYRFRSGAVATLEVTWTGSYAAPVNMRHFVGTAGQVIDDQTLMQRMSLTTSPPGDGAARAGQWAGAGGWWLGPPSLGDLATLQRPIAVLLDAVRDGVDPPGSADDAVRSLRAGLAFYQAAREGRTVSL
jgi:predicted dehydrogenase